MDSNLDLTHFLYVQVPTYSQALEELKSGRKRTHQIWFIFPQLKSLGSSHNAQFYGISGMKEAKAYLAHTVLGPRLEECARALLSVDGRSAYRILGSPDDLKLRSSMTLFERAARPGSVISQVLSKYFGGSPDPRNGETPRRRL